MPLSKRFLVQTGAALAAAALLYFIFHKPVMAAIPAAIGLLTFITGLWFPRVYTRLDHAVRWLAHALGILIAWCTLAPVYVVGFTLVRAGLALMRRDPLTRVRRGAATTAWHTRPPLQRSVSDYQQLY